MNSVKIILNYNIEILKADHTTKSFSILVNGNRYDLNVKDKFDELLRTMGFDANAANKVSDVKAPMPGLVLEIKDHANSILILNW